MAIYFFKLSGALKELIDLAMYNKVIAIVGTVTDENDRRPRVSGLRLCKDVLQIIAVDSMNKIIFLGREALGSLAEEEHSSLEHARLKSPTFNWRFNAAGAPFNLRSSRPKHRITSESAAVISVLILATSTLADNRLRAPNNLS